VRSEAATGPRVSAGRAVELMATRNVRRLPVVEDHRLVGIISQAGIACQASAQEAGGRLASISAANN